jgi:hypothetical protein
MIGTGYEDVSELLHFCFTTMHIQLRYRSRKHSKEIATESNGHLKSPKIAG